MKLLPGSWNGTLMDSLGMELVEAGADRVVITMPVDRRNMQPAGILHGGASAALAETAASIGGMYSVPRPSDAVVGIELHASHVRSAREGAVTATAVPLHRGRRTQVWDVRIVDGAGRLVCAARCTLAVVPGARAPGVVEVRADDPAVD